MKIDERLEEAIAEVEVFGSPPEIVKLSLIIVTYNNAEGLLACLQSLQNQDFNDFETILVDNDSGNSFKTYLHTYSLTYIRLKENYGASLGRNVGSYLAKGDIICFLDDDALVPSNFTRSHYQAHERHNIVAIRGKCIPINKTIYNELAYQYDLGEEVIPSIINLEGNCSFNRHVFQEVGGFNPNITYHGEGVELTYRLINHHGYNRDQVVYYSHAVIYHDYSNTLRKLIKKAYLLGKHSYLIKSKYPGFQDLRRQYTHTIKKINPMMKRSLYYRVRLRFLRKLFHGSFTIGKLL